MSRPDHVEIVEVIFVSASRGDGTPNNPHRQVSQYWSKDGRLLAELDTLLGNPTQASYYGVKHLMRVLGSLGAAVLAGEGAHA